MSEDLSRFCEKTRKESDSKKKLLQENIRIANRTLGKTLIPRLTAHLKALTRDFGFSIQCGELQIINANWYVTHTGLVRLERRKRCRGIHVEAVDSLCDSVANRFALKATVYPSKDSAGFVGCGDADPSNVPLLVRSAEIQMAGTRTVNRALPGLLNPFLLWFAFLAWPPQAIGVLPYLCQSALKKELHLLIRRAMLSFRKFCDPRFQAGSYSDKYWDSGFVHLQITKNLSCDGDIRVISYRYQ
jgi:hypothetical protein